MSGHDYQPLVRLFAECFERDYHTCLVAGHDEPYYQPAQADGQLHQVVFAHGYFDFFFL